MSGDGGDPEPNGLQYSYSEGGSIYTGPDFGCVHHDPNEPTPWWQMDNVRVTVYEDEAVYELREANGTRKVRREKLTPEQKRAIMDGASTRSVMK